MVDGLPRRCGHGLSVNVAKGSEMDLEQWIRIAGMALEHEVKESSRDIIEVAQDPGGSIP